MFAVNVEQSAETQRNNATEQQNQLITVSSDIKLIKALREEILFLREQNRLLTEKILQLPAPDRRAWWQIFSRRK